jgi:hypothetical protein
MFFTKAKSKQKEIQSEKSAPSGIALSVAMRESGNSENKESQIKQLKRTEADEKCGRV